MLFVNYAWNALSYPGNEYYLDSLNSVEAAAACCSSIVVSQNPQINSDFLDRVFVVEKTGIIKKLDGCRAETPEVYSDSDQTIPNSCEESEDEFQCSNSENSDSDLSEESEHETKEEKDPCEDPKTQALVEMQEMQKKISFL